MSEATIVDTEDLALLNNTKKKEILSYLYNYGNVGSVSELAEELDRKYSAVHRDVSQLEKAGVIQFSNYKGKSVPKLSNEHLCVSPISIKDVIDKEESEVKTVSPNGSGLYYGKIKNIAPHGKDKKNKSESIVQNDQGEKELYINIFSDNEAINHNVTIGRIGSGKSFHHKHRMLEAKDIYENLTILAICPLRSYDDIATNVIDSDKSVNEDNIERGEINVFKIDENNMRSDYTNKLKKATKEASNISGKVLLVADEWHYYLRNSRNDLEKLLDGIGKNTSIFISSQSVDDYDLNNLSNMDNIILTLLKQDKNSQQKIRNHYTLPRRPYNLREKRESVICYNGKSYHTDSYYFEKM